MRVFPPYLAADLARRDGAAPVWILRFTAAATDYILCQDKVTIAPWGKTSLPLIASWGRLSEGVTATLSDFNISSLTVNLINDPNATPNLRSLAKTRQLIGVPVSVYLWVEDCLDAPFEMFSFMFVDIDLPDESSVNVTLQDESSKHENEYPGTIVTKEAYPEADPDDVGKVIPMPFGTVSKLNALALDAGRMTSIPNAISATTATIPISDPTGLTAGMLLQVDDEIVSITSLVGSTLTVVRGISGTIAATHQRGAVIWEVKAEFVYIVADYPVTSMNKIYGKVGQSVMDISGVCTQWPDGGHPGYPGKAVVTVPGFITVAQAIDLFAYDSISVTNGNLDANLSGNVSKTGSAAMIGAVSQTGLTAMIGAVSQTGLTAMIGAVSQTGLTAMVGSVAKGNTVTLIGTIAGLGSTTLAGNIADYSVSDPGHAHNAAVSSSQNTTSQLPSVTTVHDGLFGIAYAAYVIMAFPASGARSSVSYSITIVPATSATNVYVRAFVNGTQYYLNTYTFVAGSATSFSFTVSGNILIDEIYVVADGARNFNLTAASRIIQLSDNPSSSNATNITKALANNGTLTVGSEKTYDNGTLGVNDGITVTNGTLGVNDTTTVTNGTLGVNDTTTVTNGTLGVNDTTTVTNGTLGVNDTTAVDKATLDAYVSGAIAKAGTVTVTGNSVANTLIGDAILVDVVSPITAPPDVISKILGKPCSLRGAFPAGFAFNGAITSSKRAPEWCHELARQCRSYFKWILGTPTLIARPDVLVPVKSITEIRLNNGAMIHGQKQTDINDVINTINLRYDRDWSSTSSGDEVYRQVSAGSDPTSIATYGIRERPELFRFDFVTNPAMAANLAAFYLSWYAWQRWQHTQEVYLFEAALEFGDAVTLAYLEGEIGECTEVGFSPGNGKNIDKIQLTVIE